MKLSFDVAEVSKRIKDARIRKNMTQMNLADTIGVSYQAVSNWERGNSMPDISKLRELCAILDISTDYLLGGDMSAAVEKAIHHIEGAPAELTATELRAVAPLLPPDKLRDMANKAEEIDPYVLMGLAPFLDEHAMDKLVDKIDQIDASASAGLFPFLSHQALGKLSAKLVNTDEEIDPYVLMGLAPFLDEHTMDKLVDKIDQIDASALAGLFPFLSPQALEELSAKLGSADK